MDLKEYERDGRAKYDSFAAVVASILREAIKGVPALRLQLVTHRSKAVDSLERKLSARGILTSRAIEDEIKDLAGCRAVFYTNSDVNGFLRSRIVHENFDIVDVKVHQPRQKVGDETELYISVHYVVRLSSARAGLVEYARFAGMRCEIQIQTILNHSWAEMAHDTIYKAPELMSGFGSRQFEKLRNRLGRIMQRYLLPAGYEFDKIVRDFEELMEARQVFDSDPLTELASAVDNNERSAVIGALEKLIPYYDDPRSAWPEIVAALKNAARSSADQPAIDLEMTGGRMPGATGADILKAVVGFLESYRYVDIDQSFDMALDLFDLCREENERKLVSDAAARLAKYEIDAWEQVQHGVQSHLVERVNSLSDEQRSRYVQVVAAVLRAVLGSELEGTTGTSNSVTWRRGALPVSDSLKALRRNAIALLKEDYSRTFSDRERRVILAAMEEATRTPYGSTYSNEFATMVAVATSEVVSFLHSIVDRTSMLHREEIEESIFRYFRRYSELPETMASDPVLAATAAEVVSKAIDFRDHVNADGDFVTFKTLVGFRSVFAPAWADSNFGIEEASKYRETQVEKLLSNIGTDTVEHWLHVITVCAETQSDDMATFPTFHDFLTRLGEVHSRIAIGYIHRMGPDLARFLPAMLCGLLNTGDEQAVPMVESWVIEGRHLSDILIALGALKSPPDESLVERVTESAIQHRDVDAVLNAVRVTSRLIRMSPDRYLKSSFYPALLFLLDQGDHRWLHLDWHSWLNSTAIDAMDAEMAKRVLDAMVSIPSFSDSVDYVVGGLAKNWPDQVLAFLGDRQLLANRPEGERPPHYEALPHSTYSLGPELRKNAEALMAAARKWFEVDPYFRFRGGYFVAAVFEKNESELTDIVKGLLAAGERQDIEFVTSLLIEMEGRGDALGLVKQMVAQLPEDDELIPELRIVLESSGVVTGEYGMAELYQKRRLLVEPWLEDQNEKVRNFAKEFTRLINNQIAEEQGRARASIAGRRLDYDEAIDDLLSLDGDDNEANDGQSEQHDVDE